MRVLLLSGEYPPQPGGVGDYTHKLATALVARGHSLWVATIQQGQFMLYELLPGSSKSKIQNPKSSWGWACWRDVLAALAAVRPDVLHIQYQTGAYAMHPAINLLPWRLRGLDTRPKVAVTFHDLLEPYLLPKAGPLRRWVTLRLARDADLVVATNDDDAARLAGAGVPTSVIPIGSNITPQPPAGYARTAWRAQLGVAPDDTLVAYFGLLSRSKGVDLLLDAFAAQQWPRSGRAHLVLIGGEATAAHDQVYAAEVLAQIARLQGGSVIRTGQVDEQTVSAHLLAADCVALPFRDGASFRRGSLLAALAHGCAIVTTTPGGIATGLEAATLLVPPNDVAGLGEGLRRLASDDGLREQLGIRARALAAGFTWETIAAQHERLYV